MEADEADKEEKISFEELKKIPLYEDFSDLKNIDIIYSRKEKGRVIFEVKDRNEGSLNLNPFSELSNRKKYFPHLPEECFYFEMKFLYFLDGLKRDKYTSSSDERTVKFGDQFTNTIVEVKGGEKVIGWGYVNIESEYEVFTQERFYTEDGKIVDIQDISKLFDSFENSFPLDSEKLITINHNPQKITRFKFIFPTSSEEIDQEMKFPLHNYLNDKIYIRKGVTYRIFGNTHRATFSSKYNSGKSWRKRAYLQIDDESQTIFKDFVGHSEQLCFSLCFYFEILIKDCGSYEENPIIGIGFSKREHGPDNGMVGWEGESIGFHADDCKVYDNDGSSRKAETIIDDPSRNGMKNGSVMGAYYNLDTGIIKFTKDGKMIEYKKKIYFRRKKKRESQFLPTISLTYNKGIVFEVLLGRRCMYQGLDNSISEKDVKSRIEYLHKCIKNGGDDHENWVFNFCSSVRIFFMNSNSDPIFVFRWMMEL